MRKIKKIIQLVNNYVIFPLLRRPSTSSFWYKPEPSRIQTRDDLARYERAGLEKTLYPIDYRQKLKYTLKNSDGIIVLPYDYPIGNQVNPEAAFQYALGLHDSFCMTGDSHYLNDFMHYAEYFLALQTPNGLWPYQFDWFSAKAPWYSALAQSRGASVMARAFIHTKNNSFRYSAVQAMSQFDIKTSEGGFLHRFLPQDCYYFEEYPSIPTGVINGFMSSLISLWDVRFHLNESQLSQLWEMGIASLEKMLPYYTSGWWSLYDLDPATPVINVNSPRYHLLECHYLQILSILSGSNIIKNEYIQRINQYKKHLFKIKALGLKLTRKILYR